MRLTLAIALFASLSVPTAVAAERPIVFSSTAPAQGALVIPVAAKDDLGRVTALDAGSRAAVERALDDQSFDYSAGSTLLLHAIGPWSRLLLVGTGPAPLSASALQDIGGHAAQNVGSANGPVTIVATGLRSSVPTPEVHIATGARLGGYSFDKYKYVDPAKPVQAGASAPITIVGSSPQAANAYARDGRALADAVHFARDLATEPANILYPEVFVKRTRAALSGVRGASLEVLDVPRMERLGMGSILSVGKGSARPPRMLIVEYRGASGAPLVALAGKGITFDSGGISLKPGSGMWAMKGDMGGAAAVVGAVMSLARAQAPVNVIAIAALAENMPGGSATRPGDVVRAYNGRTIEILNTDAEGRLVLADAVAYAESRYRPAVIVDVATLTGAVGTALGDEYAGLLTRNDALAAQLLSAGSQSGEELWRLPLHPNYAKDMDSEIADIKNVVEGGGPGAGLGAHFIGYFVDRTPWAHLDIAGVDLRKSSLPTVPEGFSGFGVRLLDRFVRDFRPVPVVAAGSN
ncbi:MAG: leucyl aminopeptidase [Pseudomonadota bacterium]|nr:leucyl aminopeptidase [Pseudomonadota bacterium]